MLSAERAATAQTVEDLNSRTALTSRNVRVRHGGAGGGDSSHVLMTADAVGGVWTYAVDLCRALADHGVRISLVVLGPEPSHGQREEVARLANVSVYTHPGRLEWMDDPWSDVDAAGEWLLGLADNLRPDVVHLNGYCHAALPWPVPVLVAGHSCVLSWWRAVRGEDAPRSWQTYSERVRRGLQTADLVVAPTRAMLDALQEHYGPLAHASIIANGRHSGAGRVRKEPFVLTAGRLWDEAKNVDTVCRVAPRLAWPVYVAGDAQGPGTGVMSCDSVHLLGRLDALAMNQYMARASIYALPARYEPFGLSVLEGALAGCALVLGDIRSLREIWGDAALYVAPDNAAMLTGTLTRLIEDEELRTSMARRARMRAQAFTPRRMAEEYRRAYSELTREVRPVLSLGAV